MPSLANYYSQWRACSASSAWFRETPQSAAPSERLLQRVWQQQRLLRDQLRTLDGRKLTILHPGFWNHEAGPDFREAIIQIEGSPCAFGDVEIDLRTGGWTQHGHEANPAYKNVVLHVIWDPEGAREQKLPTLALKPFLDAPAGDLAIWLGANPDSFLPGFLTGKCCAPLQNLDASLRDELLLQAAKVRLQAKAHQFLARAKEAGWTQSLWEGLFAGLGYKHNVWPMRRVAEILPMLMAEQNPLPVFSIQACLLGISGLLPHEIGSASSDAHARQVWDLWWRARDRFQEIVLPRAVWRLSGVRPANRPERRLALAAHWLARGDLSEKVEHWLAADIPDHRLLPSLLEVLETPEDPFWSRHWTLRSKPLAQPQPLLGPQRATDLAVNIILPWLWSRAGTAENKSLQQKAEERYFAWPAAEDNSVLRLVRQRLFASRKTGLRRTAAMQQALLQVVRDFCSHSDSLCQNCEFPGLVAQIKPSANNA